MACEKYRDDEELLALFDSVFDKEIKESRKKKLFAHLDACASCSLQYKLYEAMINGMERLEEVEAPLDLTAGVMKGIQAEPQPQWEANPLPFLRPASTSWMWAGAFAVAFFLMVGTFVNWDGNQPPRQASLPPAPVGNEVPHLGEDRTLDDLAAPQPRAPRVAANPDLGIILVQHQGDVEVLDLATNQWRAIRGQENLNFGDRLRTGATGEASLEYRNPPVALRIKPESTLQVVDRQTLRVFAGNTWVSVKKKGTVFRTETPNAIASVRGTKYSVEVRSLPSLYGEASIRALTSFLAPREVGAKPTHNAPVSTADLAVYSTQLSFALLKALADPNLPTRGATEVKVYESVVEVMAKNSSGVEVSAIDVSEGFGSRVQLAAVHRPRVLTQNDLLAWQSVMPFDSDLLDRARMQAGGPTAPPVTSTGAASSGAGTLPVPSTAGPVDSGPASSSERPQGFDDINRR